MDIFFFYYWKVWFLICNFGNGNYLLFLCFLLLLWIFNIFLKRCVVEVELKMNIIIMWIYSILKKLDWGYFRFKDVCRCVCCSLILDEKKLFKK